MVTKVNILILVEIGCKVSNEDILYYHTNDKIKVSRENSHGEVIALYMLLTI